MNNEERNTDGMFKFSTSSGPEPELMGADTLDGTDVYNEKDEDLGDIKETMLNIRNGRISNAVPYGRFMSVGEKLVAVPGEALKLSPILKRNGFRFSL